MEKSYIKKAMSLSNARVRGVVHNGVSILSHTVSLQNRDRPGASVSTSHVDRGLTFSLIYATFFLHPSPIQNGSFEER